MSERDEGIRLLQAGDLESAARRLQQSVEETPGDALAWSALGLCQLRQGHAEAGLETMRKAVEVGPAEPSVRFNYARALQQQGRTDDARQQVEALLAQHPDHANGRALLHSLGTAAMAVPAAGGLSYTPPPVAQVVRQAPSLGLRLLRGLGWGFVFGQWWTMWTVFSSVLWGHASDMHISVVIVMGVVYGLWGTLTGLAIAFVRRLQTGVTVGIVAGLLCCGLEALLGGAGNLINVFFYFVTGRYIGAKIVLKVHAPIST